MRPSRPRRLFMAATPALCFALASCSSPQSAPQGQNGDDEIQMGQEVFNELKAKGEIVKSSVLYRSARANGGRGDASRAASIWPSFQVLPGSRAAAKRVCHTRRERLCDRCAALFRQEHRAACRNALSRSLTHDPSRHDRTHREAGNHRQAGGGSRGAPGSYASPCVGDCLDW